MSTFSQSLSRWLRPAVFLGQNRITLTGAVLTTSAGITLVWFWLYDLARGGPRHPYAGIVLFLVLPAIFILGLALMPFGVWLNRAKMKRAGFLPPEYPPLDLKSPSLRRTAALTALATFLNLIIIAVASYRGVEYMDSTTFCGQACHSVMAPEFAAYHDSPHSRVACVDCHIGPGASWFVQSKLSGTRQLFAVTFKTYSRPIPSPVHALRPARETCEQCHWPTKFHGDRVDVRTKYSDDEANTPLTTVLVLKIGGQLATGSVGIHGRHLDAGSRISYVAIDDKRQLIPKVTYRDEKGQTVVYESTEIKATPEQLAKGETRLMDCVDCHNRPSHTFELPNRAVDKAMNAGRISPTLPFVKKKAVELLKVDYPDQETAGTRIAKDLTSYYSSTYPEVYKAHRAQIENASNAVVAIYKRNVFPSMKLYWGTHPNHIGHEDFLGCFRCHDGNHKSADGKVISAECESCHAVLAQDESDPKILKDLGLK